MTAKIVIADDTAIPPLNVTERSTAPSAPVTGDVYMDDGTNTASGNPGWRRYTGSAWEDVSAASGGGGSTFADNVFRVQDNGDATKQIALEASGITTGTTRTATMPDADVTLGTDADAIHDNVAAEISALTEKVSPASGDHILIEDSADSNNKKRVQVGNLPTGSGIASFGVTGDSGTPETVTDGETVDIAGGTGIDTSVAATNTVTIAIDSTVTTHTGTQTLTNKTIDPASNTIDGDKLDIDFTPSNYTPDATPAEADDVDDLAAHLKGIDTALAGGGGGGGALTELVAATELGVAAASISLSSIPATHQDLILRVRLRADAGLDDTLELQVNSDTGSNYDHMAIVFDNAGIDSNAGATSQSAIDMPVNGDTSVASDYTEYIIHIHHYADSTYHRQVQFEGTKPRAASAAQIRKITGNGKWKNTADAISSIQLALSSGNDFMAGSSYALYGVGSNL